MKDLERRLRKLEGPRPEGNRLCVVMHPVDATKEEIERLLKNALAECGDSVRVSIYIPENGRDRP